MYELLGALAFATLVAGYVLAVVFVRHEDDDGVDGTRRSAMRKEIAAVRHGRKRYPSSLSNARAATRSSVAQPSMNQS